MTVQDKDTVQGQENNHDKWEPDRDLVYYYSREQRLSKAPHAVKEYYESLDDKSARPGFLRNFVGNKGNIFVLLAILIICAVIILNSRLAGSAETRFTLGNNSVILSLAEEEAILILSIRKEIPRGKDVYTGAVDITASPILSEGEEGAVMAHRIFFSLKSREDYYVTLPFENDWILVILQTEYETIAHTLRR